MGSVQILHPRREGRNTMLMAVKVRTESGRTVEFSGHYAHTFDAYDDALERVADCTRIEVNVVHARAQGAQQ